MDDKVDKVSEKMLLGDRRMRLAHVEPMFANCWKAVRNAEENGLDVDSVLLDAIEIMAADRMRLMDRLRELERRVGPGVIYLPVSHDAGWFCCSNAARTDDRRRSEER